MESQSPHLKITHVDDDEQKAPVVNEQTDLIDRAINQILPKDASALVGTDAELTLTDEELHQNTLIYVHTDPGEDFTLQLPLPGDQRRFSVFNATLSVMTVQAEPAGTVVVVEPNSGNELHSDGTDIRNLSGSNAISGLTDVDLALTALQEGDVLKFDASLNKWVAGEADAGGAAFLDDLLDVDTGGTDLEDGAVLQYVAALELWQPKVTVRPFMNVREQQASGVAAGGSTSVMWNPRNLNEVITDEIDGAALSTDNVISLPAGLYYVEANAPAVVAGSHRLRLRDLTEDATLVVGPSANTFAFSTADPSEVQTTAVLAGQFGIKDPRDVRLEHWIDQGFADYGLGVPPTDPDEPAVYAEIRLWRLGVLPPDFIPPVFESFVHTNGGNDLTRTVNKPSGVVEGDLLLAIMVVDGAGTLSPPSDTNPWIELTQGVVPNNQLHGGVFYKIAAASEPTSFQFSNSLSEYWCLSCVRISGVNPANPIHDFSATYLDGAPGGSGDSDIRLNGVTLAQDGILLIEFPGLDNNFNWPAPPMDPPDQGETILFNHTHGGTATVNAALAWLERDVAGPTGDIVWVGLDAFPGSEERVTFLIALEGLLA